MKLHFNSKDGGPESHVYMYGFEWKRFFSVLLLRFERGSRESYHNHAFDAKSLLLWGRLREQHLGGLMPVEHPQGAMISTYRETYHRVFSVGRSWVLSVRGPWSQEWSEYNPEQGETRLAHGRKVV